MNDGFLYDARPQLRRSFVNELYERLNSPLPARTRIIRFLRNPEKVFVAALAAALLAGVAWQMLNTEARFVKSVNGIAIREMNYHIIDRGPVYISEREAQSLPGTSITRTVLETIELLPFKFYMPTWIPEGMALNDENADDPSLWNWMFHVEWFTENADSSVGLIVGEVTGGLATDVDVAPGKWEEIQINGVQAVLIRGDFQFPFSDFDEYAEFFSAGGKWRPAFWNDNLGIRLMWVNEGIYYELSSPAWAGGRSVYSESTILSERELIRMAESMIP